MKKFGRVVLVFLCAAMLLGMWGSVGSFALTPEQVEVTSLLVRIRVYIEFYLPNGEYGGYATSNGTGLLLGVGEEKTRILTNASVCGGPDFYEFVDGLCEQYGFSDYNVGVPQVMFDADIQYADKLQGSANILMMDEYLDIALLESRVPVYTDATVTFREAGCLSTGEEVTALYYEEKTDENYEISSVAGYITGTEDVYYSNGNYPGVRHDFCLPDTVQGGFLVDVGGAVVGMVSENAEGCEDCEDFAVSADVLKAVVSSFDCEYFEDYSTYLTIEFPESFLPENDPENGTNEGSSRYPYWLIAVAGVLFLLDMVLVGLVFVLFVVLLLVVFIGRRKKKTAPEVKAAETEVEPEPSAVDGVQPPAEISAPVSEGPEESAE
ncbi:MAG: trypsin-like peptidase domain-containing protein [Clostridia bacterium]|nr:trypsin-like peptidase domain-containing protein [Clostridia bacterium]